jgi:hypothetical protein
VPHEHELCRWPRGSCADEAATELLRAASLAESVSVVLCDGVAGLDRANLALRQAAISHAVGSHEFSGIRANPDGPKTLGSGYLESLYPWPEETPACA